MLAGVARVTSSDEYARDAPGAPRTLCVYDRRCRLHSTKPHCVEQARRAVAAAAVVEARARRCSNKLWVERTVHGSYLQASGVVAGVRPHSELRWCRAAALLRSSNRSHDDLRRRGRRHVRQARHAGARPSPPRPPYIQAVDAVLSGEARNALCAVRPPGHHAGASINSLGAPGNGYCLLNHAALGREARGARARVKKRGGL